MAENASLSPDEGRGTEKIEKEAAKKLKGAEEREIAASGRKLMRTEKRRESAEMGVGKLKGPDSLLSVRKQARLCFESFQLILEMAIACQTFIAVHHALLASIRKE